MLGAALSSIALFASLAGALPIEKQAVEKVDGTIGYLPVNEGWMNFPFGPVGAETPIMFNLFCPGIMNITDLMCSGDRFEIFDNGVLLGNTSRPVFNHCHSNSTCPDFTQTHHNWSHGSFNLLPGWHNVTIKVVRSPYHGGSGAIRVDTIKEKEHKPCPCTVDVCHVTRKDLVVVKTAVPRCQAESVCQSLGMHLANIDIDNFLDATTLAFQCSGNNSQSWVDDWNGDDYQGTCLVLSTGAAAPGGAINRPNCCSAKLPVVCQKKPCNHPRVHYSCNACQSSCFCREGHCKKCHHGHCEHAPKCGLLM